MNNFSVLPFYTSLADQYHRLSYSYGSLYKLLVSNITLIPFQIPCDKPTSSSGYYEIDSVKLYNKYDSLIKTCTNLFKNAGLTIYKSDFIDKWIILFPGTSNINLGVEDGQYYISIEAGGRVFYSDIFTLANTRNCLAIKWWDNEDFIIKNSGITYSSSFKNILYLDTQIGRPEYSYEEEGSTRDGYFFAEKQLSEKTYKFSFVAPEYLCDAIRLIRLSDNITINITEQTSYDCDNFIAEIEWQEQGDLAAVNVEFKTGTIIKKIAPGFNDYNVDYANAYTNE